MWNQLCCNKCCTFNITHSWTCVKVQLNCPNEIQPTFWLERALMKIQKLLFKHRPLIQVLTMHVNWALCFGDIMLSELAAITFLLLLLGTKYLLLNISFKRYEQFARFVWSDRVLNAFHEEQSKVPLKNIYFFPLNGSCYLHKQSWNTGADESFIFMLIIRGNPQKTL